MLPSFIVIAVSEEVKSNVEPNRLDAGETGSDINEGCAVRVGASGDKEIGPGFFFFSVLDRGGILREKSDLGGTGGGESMGAGREGVRAGVLGIDDNGELLAKLY